MRPIIYELIESKLALSNTVKLLEIRRFNDKFVFFNRLSSKILIEIGVFDCILDICDGYFAVSSNGKWGAIDFNGVNIAPIIYDFVTVDEYDYGHICLVCGRSGFYAVNDDRTIKYKGKFDVYLGSTLILSNIDKYDNGNHDINVLMPNV